MSHEVVFESRGLNKITKLRYLIGEVVLIILAVLFFVLRNMKKTFLSGKYSYMYGDDVRNKMLWISVILVILVIAIWLMTRTLNKCGIKIYNDHIEIMTSSYLAAIMNQKVRFLKLTYDQIQGTTSISKESCIIIEWNGGKSKVFCNDCVRAEKEYELMKAMIWKR